MKSKFLFALAAVLFACTMIGIGAGLLIVAPFLLAMKACKVAKRWSLRAFGWLVANRAQIKTRVMVIFAALLLPLIAVFHVVRAGYLAIRDDFPGEWQSLKAYWRRSAFA